MDLSKFDILNKKICPFCNAELKLITIIHFEHFKCINKCIKVMFEIEGEFISFRLFLKNYMITYNKHFPECFKIINYNYIEIIKMPLLNIFSYELLTLNDKIKTYLLFS